ncbi:MAG: hypothetical protein JXR53_09915, partial [Bacteroidales bacterium]|nr:hypothetical protein [Bacteroidales bacterium]
MLRIVGKTINEQKYKKITFSGEVYGISSEDICCIKIKGLMKTLLILLILVSFIDTKAQQLSPQVIASTGGIVSQINA